MNFGHVIVPTMWHLDCSQVVRDHVRLQCYAILGRHKEEDSEQHVNIYIYIYLVHIYIYIYVCYCCSFLVIAHQQSTHIH